SLYKEVEPKLLKALANGLNIGQACTACGIGTATLSDWKERHPELVDKLRAVREAAREKALAAIMKAGEKDWRAHETFLRLSFHHDYRQGNGGTNIQVNTAVNAGVVCDEATRARLVAQREQLLLKQQGSAAAKRLTYNNDSTRPTV